MGHSANLRSCKVGWTISHRLACARLTLDITRAQRDILKSGLGVEELDDTPQMWAMYKEVMGYFANGVSRFD